jgi:AcrR family transcriptional regulator
VANPADTTRGRLLATAEQLFAEQGIDAVSLREVNRMAGTKNAVAVQYHFESRTGLIKAILEKHWPGIEARRHAMLDQYEADGSADLRVLASALVRPSAAKLADSDGGPAYLRISAQLLNRPKAPPGPAHISDPTSSITRWRLLVEPLLPPDATRLHRRFTAIRFSALELGRRASSGPHTDDRLFVSHLIDLVTGILAAPVSGETRRLADDRDRSLSAVKSRR